MFITNDFMILFCMNSFCRYINIGEEVAVFGSIDSVSGSVDLMIYQFRAVRPAVTRWVTVDLRRAFQKKKKG